MVGAEVPSSRRYTRIMANNVKTAVLLALLGAFFVGLGWILGGQAWAIFALGFAVLLNFGIYFFSDRLALAASKAKPVEEHELPNVYTIVRSLTQRESMPMPRIYLIDAPQPNAFATGRSPRHAAVAVTRGIVEMMNHQELEGVLAHELAHVRNRDILIATIAATIAVALSLLARMFFWSSLGRRRDNSGITMIIGFVAMILAPIAAAIIQMAISRSREFQADHSGAESTGSPMTLASALEKLDRGTSHIPMKVDPAVSQLYIADPLKAFEGRQQQGSWFVRLFRTHPPIPERIERLQEMAMGIR